MAPPSGHSGERFKRLRQDVGFTVSDRCGSFSGFSDLLGSPLDGAVLARHVLAVPVVGGATGQAEVRVALPHSQVARTLFGVALGLASTPRETILTCECCRNGGSPEVRVLQV